MSWRHLENLSTRTVLLDDKSWKLLEDIFARRLGDVLKRSWRRLQNVSKTSWECLEYVLKTSWRRFCKASWRRLEDLLKTSWQDVLKTSWKGLEHVLKTYDKDEYIGLNQDVFWRRMSKADMFRLEQDVLTTSCEDDNERRFQDVFKTLSSRRMFAG